MRAPSCPLLSVLGSHDVLDGQGLAGFHNRFTTLYRMARSLSELGIHPRLFPAPRAGSRSRTSNTNSEPSAAVAYSCASSGPMRKRLMAPEQQRASWNSGPSGSLYERSAPLSVPANRHLPPAWRDAGVQTLKHAGRLALWSAVDLLHGRQEHCCIEATLRPPGFASMHAVLQSGLHRCAAQRAGVGPAPAAMASWVTMQPASISRTTCKFVDGPAFITVQLRCTCAMHIGTAKGMHFVSQSPNASKAGPGY